MGGKGSILNEDVKRPLMRVVASVMLVVEESTQNKEIGPRAKASLMLHANFMVGEATKRLITVF